MKKALLLITLSIGLAVNAQIDFKAEYFGKSSYRMTEGDSDEKVGNSKGSAQVYQGGVNIPLSMKLDDQNRPTMWAVNAGGAYVKLDNRNFTEPLVIDEILNMGLNIMHMRPISNKWSMLASVGAGLYMPGTKTSDMRFKNLLANVGAIFICRINPNLDLGGGVALNNSFGYPMIFPAFYLNWNTSGRYAVNVSMANGFEASVSYNVNKSMVLKLVAEMNGQMAIIEQDGKDKIFSHQYTIVGFKPEFKIGKYLSIPITAGISAMRPAEITNRELKSLFQDRGYYFQIAPYVSAGLKVNL